MDVSSYISEMHQIHEPLILSWCEGFNIQNTDLFSKGSYALL